MRVNTRIECLQNELCVPASAIERLYANNEILWPNLGQSKKKSAESVDSAQGLFVDLR